MTEQTVQRINIILLYLFVITLIGGAFMIDIKLFSINISAYRILLAIGIIYFSLTRTIILYKNKLSKYTFFFLLTWLMYACLSLIWVINRTDAFKDIYYLLIGLFSFVFFISIKKNTKNFEQKFTVIWTEVFIVVLIFSLREMITATHLMGNFTQSLHQLGPFHPLQYTPVFTFDNPNHFAIYSCLTGVIFTRDLLKGNRIVVNSFLIAACITSLYIFSSRFGILTIVVVCLILIVRFIFKQEVKELKKIGISILKIFAIILFVFTTVFVINKQERVFEKLANETLAFGDVLNKEAQTPKEVVTPEVKKPDAIQTPKEVVTPEVKKPDAIQTPKEEAIQDLIMSDVDSSDVNAHKISSNKIRVNLIKNGLDFFVKSKGMGVGAGNYRSYIAAGKNKYDTVGIRSPHNWIIEILSQYGVLIFIGFLGLFFYVFKVIYTSKRQIEFNDNHFYVILLMACYVLMSNANSIFITLPLNWLMLAMIVCFADDFQDKKS